MGQSPLVGRHPDGFIVISIQDPYLHQDSPYLPKWNCIEGKEEADRASRPAIVADSRTAYSTATLPFTYVGSYIAYTRRRS
jgi:hypothetical protein